MEFNGALPANSAVSTLDSYCLDVDIGKATPNSATPADEVVVIDWPEREKVRQDLARQGTLRLLRIGPETAAPLLLDQSEDWIRSPCSDADIQARIRTLLAHRTLSHRQLPHVDENDILRVGSRICVLAPAEASLIRALLAVPGQVVTRETLLEVGWPNGTGTRNALDLRVMRLRRRVEPLGVMLRTVRNRGYLIEFDE